MSDQVQVTFLTQLPLILGALGLLAGVVANIVLSFRNGQRLVVQGAKADTLLESTATIHKLVNSTTDELKATIVTLRADAVLQTARIAELTALTLSLQTTIAGFQNAARPPA